MPTREVTVELNQVRYFLAVFETRNFTRAAEHCHVSQPALTKAIKKLEAELGGAVFHRERGGAKLTALGEMVLPRFLRMAEESAFVTEIAQNHRLLRKVPVRIGVLDTIGPHRLAQTFEAFHRAAPEVELEVRVMRQVTLIKRLEDAELQLAVANIDVATEPWLVVRALYHERYVVALPSEHPLANKESVSLADMEEYPYIDRLACELRDLVAEACAQRGVNLYASYRTDREAWIESLVRAGIGTALLPEHSLISPETVRRPLVEPAVSRNIAVLRNVDHALSPAARALWDMLKFPKVTQT